MKTEELLQAIGCIDEGILAESELSVVRKPKRSVWRFAAAAALISLMAVTVSAVGLEFLGLHNISHNVTRDQLDWVDFAVDENGVVGNAVNQGSTQGIHIRAQIPTNPDAPRELAQAYVPAVPDHWVFAGAGYALSDGELSQFSLTWEPSAEGDGFTDSSYGPDGYIAEDCVSFRQYSAYFYNNAVGGENCLDTLLSIPDRVQVTSEITTLGGISVLRVNIPAFRLTEEEMEAFASMPEAYMSQGETHLFWSDGNSIFALVCPAWFQDSLLEELLTGIYRVEDIQSYLDELIRLKDEQLTKP